MSAVRVRFAPSPTGHLHIGGLRCALFNWLYAKQRNGTFVMRIEDTDFERSKPEYTSAILQAFEWVNIASDEPLVYQSERLDLYKSYVERLLASGNAYWSDATTEENGKSALRFRVPRDRKSIVFHDLIRGEISFDISELEDFVIARADGTPLYNFVVVVDDFEMRISHVIRGEDHISNTPKQILMYEALGAPLPQFAHLPLILGSSGQPLSKRDAATSVMDYQKSGHLPDALCNYLVRLGWAHGDQEIFTRDEMIRYFALEQVHPSGAIFDMAKLNWMNGVYLRNKPAAAIIAYIEQTIDPNFSAACEAWTRAQLEQMVTLYKERATTICELIDLVKPLSVQPELLHLPKEMGWNSKTADLLEGFEVVLMGITTCEHQGIEKAIKTYCAETKCSMPELAKPVRFALTGTLNSPSISQVISVLGCAEAVQRIGRFKELLRRES